MGQLLQAVMFGFRCSTVLRSSFSLFLAALTPYCIRKLRRDCDTAFRWVIGENAVQLGAGRFGYLSTRGGLWALLLHRAGA
jgi:hypothetical protein